MKTPAEGKSTIKAIPTITKALPWDFGRVYVAENVHQITHGQRRDQGGQGLVVISVPEAQRLCPTGDIKIEGPAAPPKAAPVATTLAPIQPGIGWKPRDALA